MNLRILFQPVLFIISFVAIVSIVSMKSIAMEGLPPAINIAEDNQNVLFIPNSGGYQKFNAFKVFDMNRDGFDDVILQAETGESGLTTLILYYGGPQFSPESQFPEFNIRKLHLVMQNLRGIEPDDYMAGDVNEDGRPDIIIFYGVSIYVIPGERDWIGDRVITKDTPGIIKIYSENISGLSIPLYSAWVADIDHDGITDIITATNADRYNIPSMSPRQLQILYGDRDLPPSINLYETGLRSLKIMQDTSYVVSFSALTTGDLDEDGKAEIITPMGNYRFALFEKQYFDMDSWRSRNYVIYGNLLNSVQYAGSDLSFMERISGIVPIMRYPKKAYYGTGRNLYELGNALVAGDMNSDGYDDLVMAFHNIHLLGTLQPEIEHDYSEIYLLYGKNDFLWSGDVAQLKDVKFISAAQDDGLGYTMHMGDINGDGYGDLLLGCYQNYSISSYINNFCVVYGGYAFPDSMTIGGVTFAGGVSVAGGRPVGAGDVNGDGYDDIVGNSNNGPFILFGRGPQYSQGETIVRDMPRSAEAKYSYNFANSAGFHFNFIKGKPGYFTRLSLTNFGKSLPDSLINIPLGDGSGIVALISAELTDMPSNFSMQCSFSYSDSIISGAAIAEEDLSVSCWDDNRNQWSKVPVTLDTAANRVTFVTDHLSLWALVDVNNSIVAAIDDLDDAVPLDFQLSQNYPNPFNPVTTIKYQVSQSSQITLRIYNILGREVKTLVNGYVPEGEYEIEWDGTDNSGRPISSGVYIYRMTTNAGFAAARKLVFLK